MKRIMSLILVSIIVLSAFFITSPRALADESAGLVGYWKFEEGSGNIASDSSGNGNVGVLINGPMWVPGRSGKALRFDGTEDYVQIAPSSSLDVSSQLTVEAWVYAKSYVSSQGHDSHVVSRCDYSGGHIYVLGTFSYGKVSYSVNPYPDAHPSADTLLLESWTYVAMTYDGAYVRLYINGILDSSYALSGPIETTANWLAIGCKPTGSMGGVGTYAYFNGVIDEVRIYNRALNRDEIVLDMGSDFEIWVYPSSTSVRKGQAATYSLSVGSINGFNSEVSFSGYAMSSSEHISVSFDPTSVTPPAYGIAQSKVTVVADNKIKEGMYAISISATAQGKVRLTTIELVIADYELFLEMDYMEGHRPSSSVLNHIRDYYIARSIAVFFYIDDSVPSDASLTDAEFWGIEAVYNNMGNDKVPQPGQGVISKWKWILYGARFSDGAFGSTRPIGKKDGTAKAGNYVFVADLTCDEYANSNSGTTTPEEVEAIVLMHEIGHCIGIVKFDNNGNEVYDRDSGSVMTFVNTYRLNGQLDEGYSPGYWELRNMEYYKVGKAQTAHAAR